jgi:hypothetical protein
VAVEEGPWDKLFDDVEHVVTFGLERPVKGCLIFNGFFMLSLRLLEIPTHIVVKMDAADVISLANKRTVRPAPGYPFLPDVEISEPRLNICVVFTSVESTLTALRKAGTLADSLGARIALLAPQVVPYPLQLENSPVPVSWNESRFEEIASQSPAATAVHIYLCRDRFQTLRSVLRSGSIVFVGCRRRSWFTSEVRLARKLRRLGHEVILTESE